LIHPASHSGHVATSSRAGATSCGVTAAKRSKRRGRRVEAMKAADRKCRDDRHGGPRWGPASSCSCRAWREVSRCFFCHTERAPANCRRRSATRIRHYGAWRGGGTCGQCRVQRPICPLFDVDSGASQWRAGDRRPGRESPGALARRPDWSRAEPGACPVPSPIPRRQGPT